MEIKNNNNKTLYFPNINDGEREEKQFGNSIILIGANGTGKSRLGAWLERNNYKTDAYMNNTNIVYRITGQRNLNFTLNAKRISMAEAKGKIKVGIQEKNDFYDENASDQYQIKPRYKRDGETTTTTNDFSDLINAILHEIESMYNSFIEDCKQRKAINYPLPALPDTILLKLNTLWGKIFKSQFTYNHSNFMLEKNNGSFLANKLSDGERAVLFYICYCLIIEEECILIIDEPELFLHPSLMNKLWSTLEEFKPKCTFIYITHDLAFATNHSLATKIWVKDYQPNKQISNGMGKNHAECWDYEILDNTTPYDELSLKIIGSRKNALFIEGSYGSYDEKLYSKLYPEYLIIPCGGCDEVVKKVLNFNKLPKLHYLNVFGLIDRDYRTEKEIASNKEKNVYTLEVAEVENLYITEPVMHILAKKLNKTDVVTKAVNEIKQKYLNDLEKQINNGFLSEIKYQAENKIKQIEDINEIANPFDNISDECIKREQKQKFEGAKDNINTILEVFNEKNLIADVCKYFSLQKEEYVKNILELFNSEYAEEIRQAMLLYLPTLPEVSIEK